MKIKRPENAPLVQIPGYSGVKKQIILGPEDGSEEIVLRYFTVAKGGTTACHGHDFPHLVKIEAGRGVVVDTDKTESPLRAGDYVYVGPGEFHCFRNAGDDPLEFICIVPVRGEQVAFCCAIAT